MRKALLVIDMLAKDVPALYNRKTIVRNQACLMRAFRAAGQKVVLVGGKREGARRKVKNPVMLRLWGDETKKNKKPLPLAELLTFPLLLEQPYDLHLDKPEYSAFYKTGLEAWLCRHKVDEIYLVGIYAGCCVCFTGADAAMRGIQPFIVADAVASPSRKRTRMNIDNFTTFMGPAITTDKLLKTLEA